MGEERQAECLNVIICLSKLQCQTITYQANHTLLVSSSKPFMIDRTVLPVQFCAMNGTRRPVISACQTSTRLDVVLIVKSPKTFIKSGRNTRQNWCGRSVWCTIDDKNVTDIQHPCVTMHFNDLYACTYVCRQGAVLLRWTWPSSKRNLCSCAPAAKRQWRYSEQHKHWCTTQVAMQSVSQVNVQGPFPTGNVTRSKLQMEMWNALQFRMFRKIH